MNASALLASLCSPSLCSRPTYYAVNDRRQAAECKSDMARRRAAIQRRIDAMGGSSAVAAALASLMADGLRWSPVGLDYTPVLHKRGGCHPACDMGAADIESVLRCQMAGAGKSEALTYAFFAADQPARLGASCQNGSGTTRTAHRARGPRAHRPLLGSLLDDGYAIVEDWGLDMQALSAQAYAALHAAAGPSGLSRHHLVNAFAPLPALEPLLADEGVAAAIRNYLGGAARYEGHVCLYLASNATEHTYAAAQFHHDRCGRRLKLWVYLEDVIDYESTPTVIARGSHNMMWQSFGSGPQGWLARFADTFVHAHHEVVPMMAPRGGGFIFDTNALHRADVATRRRQFKPPRATPSARARAPPPPPPRRPNGRVAIILEFHQHGKIPQALLSSPTVLGPCPSVKVVHGRSNETWMYGVRGYPLYPPDDPVPALDAQPGLYAALAGAGTLSRQTALQQLSQSRGDSSHAVELGAEGSSNLTLREARCAPSGRVAPLPAGV